MKTAAAFQTGQLRSDESPVARPRGAATRVTCGKVSAGAFQGLGSPERRLKRTGRRRLQAKCDLPAAPESSSSVKKRTDRDKEQRRFSMFPSADSQSRQIVPSESRGEEVRCVRSALRSARQLESHCGTIHTVRALYTLTPAHWIHTSTDRKLRRWQTSLSLSHTHSLSVSHTLSHTLITFIFLVLNFYFFRFVITKQIKKHE